MPNIKTLSIINVECFNKTTNMLSVLRENKTLRVLDIRDNNISDYKHIADLIARNQHLQKLDIRGNEMDEEKIEQLWLDLRQNISLQELLYDQDSICHIDQLASDCIYQELLTNKFIVDTILPRFLQAQQSSSTELKLSLANFRLSDRRENSINSIQKFIKIKGIVDLNLTNTDIDGTQIKVLVAKLIDNGYGLTSLNLSRNNLIDKEACKAVAILIEKNTALKHLDCSYTNIDVDGFKIIMRACRRSTIITSLKFELCRINLEQTDDWEDVRDSLMHNTSITELNLKGSIIEDCILDEFVEELKLNAQIVEMIYPIVKL